VSEFRWNLNGENAGANLNKECRSFYTTEVKNLAAESRLFTEPFLLVKESLKAFA